MTLEITKPVTNQEFVVNKKKGCVALMTGAVWLKPIMKMHKAVRDELVRRNQGHFLLPKPESYFLDLLSGKSGQMIGVFNDAGVLAGFTAVVVKDDLAQARKDGAITYPDPDGALATNHSEGKVAFIQSLCVSLDEQGKRRAEKLLHAAAAQATGTLSVSPTQLFAQVAFDNRCSWKKFLQSGFVLSGFWGEKDGAGKDRQKVFMQYLAPEVLAAAQKGAFVSMRIGKDQPLSEVSKAIQPVLKGGQSFALMPAKPRDMALTLGVVARP